MKRSALKTIRLCLLLVFLAGCGVGPGTTVAGGHPAAPPGPPAELPSALRYPSDLGINVDTVGSSAAALQVSEGDGPVALVGSGGDFSQEISLGPLLFDPLSQFVNFLLQPLPTFDIPVRTCQTNFHIAVPVGDKQIGDSPETQPETLPESQPSTTPETQSGVVDIKIDFSDFDFNGGGHTLGCSGHTAALPICYRIWFNGEQRMAGFFTDFPTPDNPAAGEFRILLHQPSHNADPATDVYVGVVYDHRNPLLKSTEIFERFVPAGATPDQKDPSAPDFHTFVSQDGPDATAKKQLSLSAQGFPDDFPSVTATPAAVQYIGQWREDNDFWSGSVLSHNIDIQNFTDACALISTGVASNSGNCLDLGIDVGALPFLDFLETSDAALPADFPLAPTFTDAEAADVCP